MEIVIPATGLISELEKRVLSQLAFDVEELTNVLPILTKFEDEFLLDNPTQEFLEAHKKSLERGIGIAKFLALATQQPEFPDRELARTVNATLSLLQDKMRIWHGSRMSKDESDRVLAKCFPDES